MIDWFTVSAQAINFLILVGLLKYFLYDRVLAAIDERNKEIENRQIESERQLLEADKELDNAKQKSQEIEREKDNKRQEVNKEIDEYYRERKKDVRIEMNSLRKQWAESIRKEQISFLNELKKRSLDSVWEISRKVLGDLADAKLESQLVSRFLKILKSLPPDDREDLSSTLSRPDQVAVVQSKFQLPDEVRLTIKNALQNELAIKPEIRFEVVDDIGCGIALQTSSHKFSWNVYDYLIELENSFVSALHEQTSSFSTNQFPG